ncbi:UDP-glucuronosyltransferase-like [Betta splendens]|uniref:glucuronosyltransferase n=1 Tax=Betta splendens TaxID=158456 RepID=A0A6P7LDR5_BETSP|nr:UDP-glucuronosyltransferase-like [Betta splendens]
MSGGVWFPTLGLVAWLCFLGPVQGGKVLVVPVDGSHWLSMKIVVKELVRRGHDALVLVPESSMLIHGSENYRTEVFPVPYTQDDLDQIFNKMKDGVFVKNTGIRELYESVYHFAHFLSLQVDGCDRLLSNKSLMTRLKDEGFDLVLTDPFLPCGSMLSHAFSIPAVYFLHGLPCELHLEAIQCPSPLSYVPVFFSENTDVMTFPQRVKNMLMSLVMSNMCKLIYRDFDTLVRKHSGGITTYQELMSHGAIWLLRSDFAFDWPRPIMSNIVFIGGINCAKTAPLPADLEAFVDGSGDDGFIIFTLGSMVSKMPEDKAKEFFDAFKQLPQRVLWRFDGVPPTDVPKNIKLLKWLPQNDLLGHPKAKVIITHGGSHSIYEAICNAVPMLVFPLFGDQLDNVHRMLSRGVAEKLTAHDVTTEKVLTAVNKLVNDKRYKENMVKLSAAHLDRPVEPLESAVFWTEFVIRHKGAPHLRVAAHDLNWIQYHSLDVIGFLLIIVLSVVFVTVKCCLSCIRKCCRSSKRKSD